MSLNIGIMIKELRTNKKLTLKELSNKSGLSTGFLSQLERGLTTVAVESLQNIADCLDVDLAYFFTKQKKSDKLLMCSYEQSVTRIEANMFIHSHLSNDLSDKDMFPELVTLLPVNINGEEMTGFKHDGEEFIYVLEGILTLLYDQNIYKMYPGDSIHLKSNRMHNWCNETNKTTKILVVKTPNPFTKK